MQINTFIVTALSIVLSATVPSVQAEEPAFEFSISSIKDTTGAELKIPASAHEKGVFVTAVGGWSTTYTKTANLLKAKLVERGIKIVEKPEDAAIGIQIYGLAFDLEEVETGLDAGFDGKNTGAIIAGAFLTGGISLIGELHRPFVGKTDPVKYSINAFVTDNPTVSGRGKLGGDNKKEILTEIVVQANDDGAKRANATYLAFIDNLVENHFVFAAPAGASPATTPEASAQDAPDTVAQDSTH